MPSILHASTTGKPLLVCLANLLLLLLLLLGPSGVRGASLRDHRPRGGEQDGRQAPDADMLKALEYIESLRQRTDSRQRAPLSVAAATAGRLDDVEKLRGVLRLAANPPQEEEEDEGREDKSEELLQAVLSTLQQTERASSPAGLRPSSPTGLRPSSPAGLRPSLLGGGGQRRQHSITPHRKLPLMFEDEEEGEGDEEGDEDKYGDGAEREIPFKRTKENLEEKYTPQNLATLESVFDELDKLTGAKSAHKRQDEDAAGEEEEEDGDGVFNVRNVAYDDLAEWGPLQERDEEDDDDDDEEEEEEEDDGEGRQEFDRGLDYVDDAGEEDEGRYPLGTSKLPDDATNLMDYYLLRVLEKTEEEEQKRAVEEEEEEEEERRAERRAASTQHRDGVDPQAVYQLIQISQKYQIPPGDLLDMLKTTGRDEPAKGGGSARYDPPRAAPKRTHKAAEADLHDRRLPDRQKTPEELRTEEILDILGLGSAEDGERAPARKRKQHGSSAPTPRRLPSKLKDDYDDGGVEEDADEDELAAYLAARMLEQYRGTPYGGGGGGNMASQKRGSYEEAIHSYFDGMDSEKSENEKRRSEQEERGYEDEALKKLMSYLNPETEESENDAKSSQGI